MKLTTDGGQKLVGLLKLPAIIRRFALISSFSRVDNNKNKVEAKGHVSWRDGHNNNNILGNTNCAFDCVYDFVIPVILLVRAFQSLAANDRRAHRIITRVVVVVGSIFFPQSLAGF